MIALYTGSLYRLPPTRVPRDDGDGDERRREHCSRHMLANLRKRVNYKKFHWRRREGFVGLLHVAADPPARQDKLDGLEHVIRRIAQNEIRAGNLGRLGSTSPESEARDCDGSTR